MVKNIPEISAEEKRRFIEKISKSDGCWSWTGKKHPKSGRGMVWLNKQYFYAPRVSYTLFVDDIPDGLQVLHTCDNPNCVNPEHLFLGTQLENVIDRDQKGRNRLSHKYCVNGHEFTPENTRYYGPQNRYRMCRACGRENERRYRQKFITRLEAEEYV
jgi:hypothetical protein